MGKISKGMYKITVKSHFSAAHRLRGYRGKCENLHGHNWMVKAVVAAIDLNKIGIIMDFQELKEILNEVLKLLDHKYLNELHPFKKVNPTSENIAKFIYDKLNSKIKNQDIKLVSVDIGETGTSYATYQKE